MPTALKTLVKRILRDGFRFLGSLCGFARTREFGSSCGCRLQRLRLGSGSFSCSGQPLDILGNTVWVTFRRHAATAAANPQLRMLLQAATADVGGGGRAAARFGPQKNSSDSHLSRPLSCPPSLALLSPLSSLSLLPLPSLPVSFSFLSPCLPIHPRRRERERGKRDTLSEEERERDGNRNRDRERLRERHRNGRRERRRGRREIGRER